MQKRYTLYNIMIWLAGMTATILASCSTRTIYDSYAHTPLAGWEKNDTLTFDIPKVAMNGTYNENVGLRMTNSFPFTSISLIVEQNIVQQRKTITDTIKCPITDERGNFLGDGISTYQYSLPLRDVKLNKGDSIHISIRHNMKREILPGVSDIGIKIDAI